MSFLRNILKLKMKMDVRLDFEIRQKCFFFIPSAVHNSQCDDSAFFHSKLNYLNSLFDLNFVSVFMFLFFFVMVKNADTDWMKIHFSVPNFPETQRKPTPIRFADHVFGVLGLAGRQLRLTSCLKPSESHGARKKLKLICHVGRKARLLFMLCFSLYLFNESPSIRS